MRHLPKTLLATLISSTFFLTPSFYSLASEPVDVDPKTPVAKEQSSQNPSLTQDDYRQILIDFENEQNTQCTIKCNNKDTHSIEIKRDDEEQANDDDVHFRIESNPRDGFYLGLSAISTFGDDFRYLSADEPSSEFDIDLNYRLQLLGFFIESPGLATRRMHGMYSLPAWGFNLINTPTWSFDVFYQRDNQGIEGLEGLNVQSQHKRGGFRATGYFDNSHLELIYSPFSRNEIGSDGVETSVSYRYDGQFKNWSYYANVGMQYRSREVTPHSNTLFEYDSRSGLSKSAGLSHSAEIGFEYPLSTDWVFGTFINYTELSNRVSLERPEVVEDGYRAGLILSFVF
ncbi:hypothetical protein PULV_a1723 [Pseudoalteromonas ulvae UL12]|uniref:MipA/OmpV family protein n=1 Tax=Pseudoalteromonas ulvae TaxID=107327 RepID=UPI00186B75B0|nr:MipA/OmpV family protein [Pseudoalteromonas ulvae]MBE0364150.1 hypothetical protein [Pseudoalteromonas ulvae UL12]